MSAITQVDKLYGSTDLDYPRFYASSWRNRRVDFAELDRYAQTGTSEVSFSLFIRTRRRRIDAVWIPGIPGPLVSVPLRNVLERVAGDDLEFLPLTVNKRPYWILRVVTMVDALDAELTEFEYSPQGAVWGVIRAVWVADRLRDPQMFVVPQEPRTFFATPGVAAAYRSSDCNGLAFGARGTVG